MTALEGDSFELISTTAINNCSYNWYKILYNNNIYYGVTDYLYICGGTFGEWNPFGIGLVTNGDSTQNNYVYQYAGDNGWILLIFAGIDTSTTAPQQGWIDSLNYLYSNTNLNIVIRLNPPWGQSFYRSESDNANMTDYTTLAHAYKAVVSQLPFKDNKNLYFQIDNEPDLCPEWFCKTSGPVYDYNEASKEYAYFFSYVADALHSIGDSRIKISTAGFAPGGNIQCGCCGQSNCANDKGGITGLQYIQGMMNAIPNIFDKIDWFASHSYPSSGIGYGFNAPYNNAIIGLTYYKQELQLIGRDVQVIITETGWATNPPDPSEPTCTQQDKATWNINAYNGLYLNDSLIMGVTPFMLMDEYWGNEIGFDYVDTNGNLMDVYMQGKQLRCKYFNDNTC